MKMFKLDCLAIKKHRLAIKTMGISVVKLNKRITLTVEDKESDMKIIIPLEDLMEDLIGQQ